MTYVCAEYLFQAKKYQVFGIFYHEKKTNLDIPGAHFAWLGILKDFDDPTDIFYSSAPYRKVSPAALTLHVHFRVQDKAVIMLKTSQDGAIPPLGIRFYEDGQNKRPAMCQM